jgi:hypothetical protein
MRFSKPGDKPTINGDLGSRRISFPPVIGAHAMDKDGDYDGRDRYAAAAYSLGRARKRDKGADWRQWLAGLIWYSGWALIAVRMFSG